MAEETPSPIPSLSPLEGLDAGELLARGMNTPRPSGHFHDWTPPTPEELARLLPQYQIEGMLGRGGMGAVYKGRQERLERTVAIKILPVELTADPQFVTRFEREARTLARLHHPGIVMVHDFGQTPDGHLYFVMEFIEGTDLRQVLQGPGLEPEQALEITVQICEALQAAHRQGVVHRDIKPANILITKEGRVKLADFGLARQGDSEQLTCTNEVVGTPDYMAPEQHAGGDRQADHRADIFALGVTLYEMLTGQVPRGAFVPPSQKVKVDVRIDEVVLKALQEEPARRYQQVGEMEGDVNRIRTSARVKAAPPPAAASTRRGWLVAGIAVAAMILAGMVAWGVLGGKSAKPERVALPASADPARQPAQAGKTIREALFSSPWNFVTHYTKTVIVFAPDGSLRNLDGTRTGRTWEIVDDRTFSLRSDGANTRLTFDPGFTRFEGRTLKARGKAVGTPYTLSPPTSTP